MLTTNAHIQPGNLWVKEYIYWLSCVGYQAFLPMLRSKLWLAIMILYRVQLHIWQRFYQNTLLLIYKIFKEYILIVDGNVKLLTAIQRGCNIVENKMGYCIVRLGQYQSIKYVWQSCIEIDMMILMHWQYLILYYGYVLYLQYTRYYLVSFVFAIYASCGYHE